MNFSNMPTTLQVPNDKKFQQKEYKKISRLQFGFNLYQAQPDNCNIYQKVAIQLYQQLNQKSFPECIKLLKVKEITEYSIVKVFDFFEIKQDFYLVIELPKQDFKSYLQENKQITNLQKLTFCQQILESIEFLHDNNMMHRELKPECFGMFENQIKLFDFGKIKKEEQDALATVQQENYAYQAPEILDHENNLTKQCDIWSLGCILYELLSGNQLFKQNSYEEIKKHKNDQKGVNDKFQRLYINSNFKKCLKKMLDPNPEARPSVKQIIVIVTESIYHQKAQFELIWEHVSQNNLDEWLQDFKQYIDNTENNNAFQQIAKQFQDNLQKYNCNQHIQPKVSQINLQNQPAFQNNFQQQPQNNFQQQPQNNFQQQPQNNFYQQPQKKFNQQFQNQGQYPFQNQGNTKLQSNQQQQQFPFGNQASNISMASDFSQQKIQKDQQQ